MPTHTRTWSGSRWLLAVEQVPFRQLAQQPALDLRHSYWIQLPAALKYAHSLPASRRNVGKTLKR